MIRIRKKNIYKAGLLQGLRPSQAKEEAERFKALCVACPFSYCMFANVDF